MAYVVPASDELIHGEPVIACSGPITEEAPIAQYVKVGRVDAITVETPYFRNAHRGEYREPVQRGARNIYVDHRLGGGSLIGSSFALPRTWPAWPM